MVGSLEESFPCFFFIVGRKLNTLPLRLFSDLVILFLLSFIRLFIDVHKFHGLFIFFEIKACLFIFSSVERIVFSSFLSNLPILIDKFNQTLEFRQLDWLRRLLIFVGDRSGHSFILRHLRSFSEDWCRINNLIENLYFWLDNLNLGGRVFDENSLRFNLRGRDLLEVVEFALDVHGLDYDSWLLSIGEYLLHVFVNFIIMMREY